jgi:hypothetical protein
MNIEIVECYQLFETNKKSFSGTVHVYLIDYGIDLRGVFITQYKNKWIVKLPSRTGIDPDTKKEISYPIFSFVDREKTKKMIDDIKNKASKYIEENIFIKS